MDVELVDIGANLAHESFADDRAAVIARARAVGVTRQIVTGADLASSAAAAALAAADHTQLWSTAGVHPHHASGFNPAVRDGLLELLRRPQVVAVGECGLDYFRNLSTPGEQRAAFVAQLEIATTVGKPVFLHQRAAHDDFRDILVDFCGRDVCLRGVAHCFTGDRAQLEDYLGLGLSIGITGWVCDERRGSGLREVVPEIPLKDLMIETDAPYLLPRDIRPRPRSQRNEPANLLHIAQVVADIRRERLADIAGATTRNAVAFFGLA